MNPEVNDILEKIRKYRIEKGMSIVQLSVESGISRSHLYYIETKQTIPTLDTLAKIADALGLKLKDFFV